MFLDCTVKENSVLFYVLLSQYYVTHCYLSLLDLFKMSFVKNANSL